jgi:hypothetical protein
MSLCCIRDCPNQSYESSMCSMHRQRVRRYGDPNGRQRIHGTRAERLAEYVDRSGGPDACWPWTKATNSNGYGVIANRDGGTALAHRAALEQHLDRKLRKSEDAMHLCNNPPCCNPAHLRAGSRAVNQAHMVESGRSKKGEHHWAVKITDEQVAEIRRLSSEGIKQVPLAEMFGISQTQVSRIVRGRQRTD